MIESFELNREIGDPLVFCFGIECRPDRFGGLVRMDSAECAKVFKVGKKS